MARHCFSRSILDSDPSPLGLGRAGLNIVSNVCDECDECEESDECDECDVKHC